MFDTLGFDSNKGLSEKYLEVYPYINWEGSKEDYLLGIHKLLVQNKESWKSLEYYRDSLIQTIGPLNQADRVVGVDYSQPLQLPDGFSVVRDTIIVDNVFVDLSKLGGQYFYPGKSNITANFLDNDFMLDLCRFMPKQTIHVDLRLAQEMLKPKNQMFLPLTYAIMPVYILGTLLSFEGELYIPEISSNFAPDPFNGRDFYNCPTAESVEFKLLQKIFGDSTPMSDEEWQVVLAENLKIKKEWNEKLGFKLKISKLEDCYFWRDYLDDEQQLYAHLSTS